MRRSETSSGRNKQKQTRKKKKELRRLRRKAEYKENRGGYSLANGAADTAQLARIINGITLSEEIKTGSAKLPELVNEIFDMDTKISLDALEKENYKDVEEKLTGAMKVVDEECADRTCVDDGAIEKGLTAIDEASKFNSEEIYQSLDQFETLQIIEGLYSLISEVLKANKAARDFISQIPKIQKGEIQVNMNEFVVDLRRTLTNLFNAEETFTKGVELVKKKLKENQDYAKMFKVILDFETQLNKLKEQQQTINYMKTTLEKLRKFVKSMRRYLTEESAEQIYKTINLILQFARSPKIPQEKKKLTPGLPGGLNDLKKLYADMKTPFVKNMIASGQDSQKVEKLMKETLKTTDELAPLVTIADAKNAIYIMEQHIESALKELEAAYSGIATAEVFEKLLNCFGDTKFNIDFAFNDWKSEKEKYNDHEKSITEFANAVVSESVSPFSHFNVTNSFLEVFGTGESDAQKIFDAAATFPQLSNVESELAQFDTTLSAVNVQNLDSWGKNTVIDVAVNNTRKLLDRVDFEPLTQCFNVDNALSTAKDALKKSQILNSLFKVTSKNDNFGHATNATSMMKTRIPYWTEFEKKRKIRETRALSRPVTSTISPDLAKKFGDGAKCLLDFAIADKTIDLFRNLLKHQSDIDKNVANLKNDEQKAKALKVWNPDTKKIIKDIVDHVDKMAKSTGKKPERLADLEPVFAAYGSNALPNFNGRDLSHFLGIVQNDKEIQEALKSIESLNLEFASSKDKLIESASVLKPLEQFFDAFFEVDRTAKTKKTDGSKKDDEESATTSMPWWLIAIICVAVSGIASGGGMAYKAFQKRKEKQKQKESDEEKFNHRRKIIDKDREKAENNSKVSKNQKEKEEGEKDQNKKTVEKKKSTTEKNGAQSKNIEENQVKPRIEKNATIVTEKMLDEDRKEKEKKEAALRKTNENRKVQKEIFKKVHNFEPSELAREQIVGDHIYSIEWGNKTYTQYKYSNAIGLSEDQEKIDNGDAERKREYHDFAMPDRLTVEQVNKLRSKTPPTTDWNGNASLTHKGIQREYLVSREKDAVEKLEEIQRNKRQSSDSLRSEQRTQSVDDGSSKQVLRKVSETNTANSSKDPNMRTAASGDEHSELVSVDLERGSAAHNENDGTKIWLRSVTEFLPRFLAGGESSIDYGFSKRPFENSIGRFVIQFIAATSRAFRNVASHRDFGKNQPITINERVSTAEVARKVFKGEDALLRLKSQSMRVVGDIHGKYIDFVRECFDILLDDTAVGLFLGDYVDRGKRSADVVYLMCLFKILFPSKFYFLRGNHETRTVNKIHGFKGECIDISQNDNSTQRNLYDVLNECFDEMPYCALFHNKIFLCHGGISQYFLNRFYDGADILSEIKKRPETKIQWGLFYDIIWGDPVYFYKTNENNQILYDEPVFTKSKRCPYATVFNQVALEKVLEERGWLLVIRAHQVKTAGFEYFSGRKLVTVFASTNNEMNNNAVQMIVTNTGKITINRFWSTDDLVKDSKEDDQTIEN